MKKLSITALLVGAAILALASSKETTEKEKEKKTRSTTPAYVVESSALFAAYKANEVAADTKFKGRVIAVNGIVETIGKDILGNPYITLKTGEMFGSVQCMFAPPYSADLGRLTKGTRISLKGVCDGKLMNVILRGCIIQ